MSLLPFGSAPFGVYSLSAVAISALTPNSGALLYDSTNNQLIKGDGLTVGGIPASYRHIPATASVNNYGPNIIGGNAGNYIDPAYSSSVILGGGRTGWENKLLHTNGQTTGVEYAVIAGGYDNVGTDLWPGVMAGAHNRVNTATSPVNGGGTPGYFAGPQGAGTVTSSGTAVTGIGTSFTTTFRQGSVIYTDSSHYQYVASVASDTSLTTVSAFSPALSGANYFSSSYYVPNDGYVPSNNTDHSSIPCGTYHAIYNSHMGVISGGTRNTLGWDGIANSSGDYSFIGGGVQNVINQAYSFIGAGFNNYIRSAYCFISGYNNQINNNASQYSAIVGQSNSVSSSGCFVAGVSNVIGTSSNYSAVFGQSNNPAASRTFSAGFNHGLSPGSDYGSAFGRDVRGNKYAQQCFSSGQFSARGDLQRSMLQGRCSTADATPTKIGLDGTTASTGYLLIGSQSTSNYTTCLTTVYVWAQTKTSTDCAGWKFEFLCQRGNGVATCVLIGGNIAATTPNAGSQGTNPASWTVAIAANTTNGTIDITVTGTAATNVRWGAEVVMREVNNP